jgi:hypothetical protein
MLTVQSPTIELAAFPHQEQAMNISLISAESVLEPLCRSYVCAVFRMVKLKIQSDAGVHATQLLWAVGVLSDHTPHYLGAWHVCEPKDAWWRAVVGDLEDRGVERLRIAIGPDPAEMQAAMAPRYRYNAVLPAFGVLSHPEIESSLSGHRQYLERALEVAAPLRLRLKRSAARHGPFANPVAAAKLLRRSADRYLHRGWPQPNAPMRARRGSAGMTASARP